MQRSRDQHNSWTVATNLAHMPAANPAGQAMESWDLSQLHRMAPDEAAQMTTFTIDAANSSTVYRVGRSAHGQVHGQPVRCQGSARGRA
jgi:hypothetical protein